MKDHSRHITLLILADSPLINAQRLSEWTGHAPQLEIDIALTNMALDKLGHARLLLQYAATDEEGDTDEDKLAFFRDVREFRNWNLTELPDGDFGVTIVRQYFFDIYQEMLWKQIKENSNDTHLQGIAARVLPEIKYHLNFSDMWLERLALGTEESRERVLNAINELWFFVPAVFLNTPEEVNMIKDGFLPDMKTFQKEYTNTVRQRFNDLNLPLPSHPVHDKSGKEGYHTEHLGFILAEMQSLQREMPGLEW